MSRYCSWLFELWWSSYWMACNFTWLVLSELPSPTCMQTAVRWAVLWDVMLELTYCMETRKKKNLLHGVYTSTSYFIRFQERFLMCFRCFAALWWWKLNLNVDGMCRPELVLVNCLSKLFSFAMANCWQVGASFTNCVAEQKQFFFFTFDLY